MILFDDINDKTFYPIVIDLFIRGRKLKISLVYIIQSCFVTPKNIRLNCTHYFIMKISNKKEL